MSMEVQTGGLACVGMLLLMRTLPPYSTSKYLGVLEFASTLNARPRSGVRMS